VSLEPLGLQEAGEVAPLVVDLQDSQVAAKAHTQVSLGSQAMVDSRVSQEAVPKQESEVNLAAPKADSRVSPVAAKEDTLVSPAAVSPATPPRADSQVRLAELKEVQVSLAVAAKDMQVSLALALKGMEVSLASEPKEDSQGSLAAEVSQVSPAAAPREDSQVKLVVDLRMEDLQVSQEPPPEAG